MDTFKALNLFWAIVWAVVLILCIVGLFWKWAMYIDALIAAVMVGMFIKDNIRCSRIK